MLSYKESLKILKETSALLDGHFILSSGLRSSMYVQCAKLLSHPKQAQLICKSLAQKIKKNYKKIDVILSPAIGGIVVGYEIGRQLSVETIFSEREEGKLILRRGFNLKKGANVLVVEDVITTGKSALECNDIIQSYKASLIGYACIIDRSNENLSIKENITSQIKLNIPTFKENEIPENLKKIAPTKPGSRSVSNEK
tara:strand:+ start:509 stop:1102 length:594 start_codon:yes stop_codon:yes gene_type:complete